MTIGRMLQLGRLRYLDLPAQGRQQGVLVLLHGFPLNPTMWDAQFSMANRGWRVLAPELRGFGADADNDPPVTSIDDYAGDAIDLLDGLHVTEAVIAGLSMGGYIAFAVFRHAARYFRGLVLADTRSEPDTPQAVDGRQRMQALVRERGPAAVADELVPKLTSDTTRRMHPEIVERLRAQIVGNSAASIHGALTALMSRPDSTPTLPGIHCPTLILVGEEDAITPPALSESMQRHIAGAELVTIPRAGHMSNMEQPAAFNDALARFLDHRV